MKDIIRDWLDLGIVYGMAESIAVTDMDRVWSWFAMNRDRFEHFGYDTRLQCYAIVFNSGRQFIVDTSGVIRDQCEIS